MRRVLGFCMLLALLSMPVNGIGQQRDSAVALAQRGLNLLFNNKPKSLDALIDSLQQHEDSTESQDWFALSLLKLMRLDAQGKPHQALWCALAVLDTAESHKEVRLQIYAGLQVGHLLRDLGNYATAQDYYSHSLRLATALGDSGLISYTNTLSARTVLCLGNEAQARILLHRAWLSAPRHAGEHEELQYLLTQGDYCVHAGHLQKAKQNLQRALEGITSTTHPYEWGTAKIGLIRIALLEGAPEKAGEYVKALSPWLDTCSYLARKLRWGLTLGNYYASLGDRPRAAECLEAELTEAKSHHQYLLESDVALRLAALAKEDAHWSRVYRCMEQWRESQDSLRQLSGSGLFLAADGDVLALARKLSNDYHQELKTTRGRVWSRGLKIYIGSSVALLAIVLLLYFVYRNWWRDARTLEGTIADLRHSLQESKAQRADLTAQLRATEAHANALAASTEEARQRVLERQRTILKSLEYAQTIQQDIVSTANHLKAHYPDSFMLQQAKESVSGDLFWFNHAPTQDIMVLADCSGHGVAGASFSFIVYMLLNMVVQEQHVSQPKQVIERLHQELSQLLQHATPSFLRTVNITLSVVTIDLTLHQIAVSSLSQSVFYGQSSSHLERIRGDAGGLGSEQHSYRNLEEHRLAATSGGTLYLATNGFTLQINGEKQRYGSARLLSLLRAINTEPMEVQAERAASSFFHFAMGEQLLDDISLIGIRIP